MPEMTYKLEPESFREPETRPGSRWTKQKARPRLKQAPVQFEQVKPPEPDEDSGSNEHQLDTVA